MEPTSQAELSTLIDDLLAGEVEEPHRPTDATPLEVHHQGTQTGASQPATQGMLAPDKHQPTSAQTGSAGKTEAFASFVSRNSLPGDGLYAPSGDNDSVGYTKARTQRTGAREAGQHPDEMHTLVDDRRPSRAVLDVQWSAYHDLVLGCYVRDGLGAAGGSQAEGADGTVLLWSLQAPTLPEFVFEAESAVLCARFCSLGGSQVVVGGSHAGQVLLWDSRCQRTPVQRSAVGLDVRSTWSGDTGNAVGHVMPVHSLELVGGSQMAVSLSTDGRLCTWDLTALHAPTGTLQLTRPPKSGLRNAGANRPHGVDDAALEVPACALAFPAGDGTRCAVGCDDGCIYQVVRHGASGGGIARELCSRELATARDDDPTQATLHVAPAHAGPVHALAFHPSTRPLPSGSRQLHTQLHRSGLLLSASADWGLKLWSCGSRGQQSNEPALLLTLEGSAECVFDAKWSPQRSSLLATADGAGCMALWNLADDIEQPAVHTSCTSKACTRLDWAADGRTVAVGDSAGRINLVGVSSLANPHHEDEARMLDMLGAAPGGDQRRELERNESRHEL